MAQQLKFPSSDAFDAALDSVARAKPTLKWRELDTGQIYAITQMRRVHTRFGDAAVARFEAQGAKVLRGVADEAFGKRAIIQDPDGRTLEIVQHQLP